MKFSIHICAMLLLCGCVTHQAVQDPAPLIAAPAQFSMEPENPATLEGAWWRVFEDPVLNGLEETALANNFTLAQGLQRVARGESLLRQARALRRPAIGASAAAGRSFERDLERAQVDENPLQIPDFPETLDLQSVAGLLQDLSDTARGPERPSRQRWETEASAGFGLVWEADLWGRLRHLASAEEAELAAMQQDFEALRLVLSAQVAEAYFEAQEQRLQHALLLGQHELALDFLELLQLRFSYGNATAVDILQQEGEVTALEAEMPLPLARLRLLENRLDVLLGTPPDGTDRTAEVEPVLPEHTALPDVQVPLALLQQRPDLRALQRRVVAADEAVGAALADRLPQLTLDATLGLTDGTGALAGVGLGSTLGLFQPLIDWGLREAAVDAARTVVQESLLAYSQGYLEAIEEVETTLWQEARQREHLAALARNEEILLRNVEEARVRYSTGVSDYLPVLTALQDLNDVQQRLLEEQRALVFLRIQLHRAVGGATAS